MKYELSKLKDKLNELGIFNISFLDAVNHGYTNEIDITAHQWIAGAVEIKHRICAITLEDGLVTLVKRAERFEQIIQEIKGQEFKRPDISQKNMIGHKKDGNLILLDDIIKP